MSEYVLDDKDINDLQRESLHDLLAKVKHAHYADIVVRIGGRDVHYEADWLKHMGRRTA